MISSSFQSELFDDRIEEQIFNQRSFSLPEIHYQSESESDNLIFYYYEKENFSNRKRFRRSYKKSSYENSQTKRMKISNRKQYFIKFSIDLTGQNINYTIEYHQKIIFLPFYYDFYYISWLQTYYYYLQIFNRECEEIFMAIF